MLRPKISFIVPVYNVEMYIKECLDSILMQTIEEKEIIIVNDGTRDNSLQVAEEYSKKYAFVKIVSKDNGGISSARNRGLQEANGEYVCFIDSDDFYTMDFAETFYKKCCNENLDIIRGWYSIYEEEKKAYFSHPLPKIDYYNIPLLGREFMVKSISQQCSEVVPWLGFFRREYLIKNNLHFPEGISYEEDQLFFFQALLNDSCCKVMQTDIEFYSYRKRKGSATKTPSVKQIKDIIYVVQHENELIQNFTFLDKKTLVMAKRYISASFYQLTSIYGRIDKNSKKKVSKLVPFSMKWQCVYYAYNRHQRMKIFLFTFCRGFVDFVYYIRKV